ncbi:hypothetical protein HBH70_145130 [Parastagonospora nodorum]|nr:hypothetical protein HBH70_145130 [Parastagonospora nodorum]KAH5146792.1 hypothetical protein HBH69_172530 [Parastagonospora nodorum]KAH5172982.1 hypothetical protein HBH77_212390 [Parastagonospora nodorum]KAH5757423.1 hypothetical protein HBI16_209090 [Parastagonospora nodorum]
MANPMDLDTPSDVSNMSTTSDPRLGDRGLRLLTLVERLCKEQRQPHPACKVRKFIPLASHAGPYLIRTLMHSSTCARDANLVHCHLSTPALRDTARCFGASQRNGAGSRTRLTQPLTSPPLLHTDVPQSTFSLRKRSAVVGAQETRRKGSMRDLCSAERLATRLHIMIAVWRRMLKRNVSPTSSPLCSLAHQSQSVHVLLWVSRMAAKATAKSTGNSSRTTA